MSGSSGLSGPKRKTTQGFSESDVNLFLQRGSQLASRKSSDPSLSGFTPQQKQRSSTFLPGGAEVLKSGFMGKFSTMSKEQIESLASQFKQREQSIHQRRGQPGRSSLFMARG